MRQGPHEGSNFIPPDSALRCSTTEKSVSGRINGFSSCKTNIFHVALDLYIQNTSGKILKFCENISDTLGSRSSRSTFFIVTTFWSHLWCITKQTNDNMKTKSYSDHGGFMYCIVSRENNGTQAFVERSVKMLETVFTSCCQFMTKEIWSFVKLTNLDEESLNQRTEKSVFVAYKNDWLPGRLIDKVIDWWRTDWLIDWLTVRLSGWLTD